VPADQEKGLGADNSEQEGADAEVAVHDPDLVGFDGHLIEQGAFLARNAAALLEPRTSNGVATSSSPKAAITVTDSHEAGAGAITRSTRGARPWVGVIAEVTPV
jgi:hypothetical protein